MARMTLRPNAVRLNTAMLAIASLIPHRNGRPGVPGVGSIQGGRRGRRPCTPRAKRSRRPTLQPAGCRNRTAWIPGHRQRPVSRALQPRHPSGAIRAREPEQPSTPQPGQTDRRMASLNALVSQKLAELGETIDLRRKQGIGASTEIVLRDQGKQLMDEIRVICSAIREQAVSERSEIQTPGRDSRPGRAIGHNGRLSGSTRPLFRCR